MKTSVIDVDQITVGTKIIPKGRKRPLTVRIIFDNQPGKLELMCDSTNGNVPLVLSRYDTITAVVPDRLPPLRK